MIDDHWNNQKALEVCSDMPLLIIHGQNDHVIPYEHGRALYACAPTSNKMGFFPNWLSHNQWRSEESFNVMAKFLQRGRRKGEGLTHGHLTRSQSSECPGGENLLIE